MRSSFCAAVLALASSVVAQTPHFDVMSSPAQGQVIPAGSSFDIIWDPNSVPGTITITLIQGPASNALVKGPVIASGVDNSLGKFTWSPVPSGQFAAYGFNITSDADPSTYQLSNGFQISGGSTPSSGGSTPSPSTPSPTPAASGITTTVRLAPGPAYTPPPNTTTTSSISTTSSVSTTTQNATETSSAVKAVFTSSANVTATTPVAITTLTTQTTPLVTATPVTVASPVTTPSESNATTPSSISSPTPKLTSGAAANFASGGLAMIGGLVLAFAL